MTAAASSLILRTPHPGDRGRVRAIVESTGVFRPSEVAVALEVFDGAMAQPGADYHALGAYDDDRLVGFTLYGPTPGTEATWDLYWIAVHPTTHRAGVGRRLMVAAEAAIREHGGGLVVVETSSRADYAPTRAFYERLAYEQAARIPGYYAPGDDLIVYTKRISLPPSSGTPDHG